MSTEQRPATGRPPRAARPAPRPRPATAPAVPLMLLLALLGAGCGPDVATSSTEATVSGTVTIRGKPASGGSVVFDPSNVRRRGEMPRTAEIGPDGTYRIATLVGGNVISLTGSESDRDAGVGTFQLPVDVEPGENTIDIEVP